MSEHTTEGLMQLVSEFGQCRWSEGTYGASFIAKGQERGQREEAAKLYEEIRSYATALCQQGERDAKDAARYRWLRDVSVPPHNFYISVPDEFAGTRYSPQEVDSAIDAALSTSEGKTE